ncbi:MAG: threonine synthase, partial [Flavobacteriaceae bacterium]|nr:threonine synthase [Flavobacteriaceae bacterium]
GVKGIKVIILYPSGKVSDIQEKQLTTLGDNVYALEVEGVFDDCQDMVKTAFIDKELTNHINLTSANSINVARWLPQMFYYIFAFKELGVTHDKLSFSVPSGNFGNICAGLVARKLGLPIDYFVASTNVNDIVPTYLKNGEYIPKPSVATISNAMDVGNPSNFIRIQNLFDNNFENLKEHFQSYSFNDLQTISAINELYTKYNYIADPHGAVAYLGSKTFLESHHNYHSVFLETAHPAKFLEIVEKTLNLQIQLPPQLKSVLNKEKVATKIKDYSGLKNFLLNKD